MIEITSYYLTVLNCIIPISKKKKSLFAKIKVQLLKDFSLFQGACRMDRIKNKVTQKLYIVSGLNIYLEKMDAASNYLWYLLRVLGSANTAKTSSSNMWWYLYLGPKSLFRKKYLTYWPEIQ